jgi:hypothetical protein
MHIRGKAACACLALAAATAVPVGSAFGAPAAASHPPAGVIHLVISFTNPTSNTGSIIITGAFSDHGTAVFPNGPGGPTFHLTKGKIVAGGGGPNLNPAPNPVSCSIFATGKGKSRIKSGTGAYVGIHGQASIVETIAGILPRLANGQCNTANNAVPVAFTLFADATATVKF